MNKRIAELEAYADKLAAGLPEGMLPKDIENIRQANVNMATQIIDLVNKLQQAKELIELLGDCLDVAHEPHTVNCDRWATGKNPCDCGVEEAQNKYHVFMANLRMVKK